MAAADWECIQIMNTLRCNGLEALQPRYKGMLSSKPTGGHQSQLCAAGRAQGQGQRAAKRKWFL